MSRFSPRRILSRKRNPAHCFASSHMYTWCSAANGYMEGSDQVIISIRRGHKSGVLTLYQVVRQLLGVNCDISWPGKATNVYGLHTSEHGWSTCMQTIMNAIIGHCHNNIIHQVINILHYS